MSIDTPAKIAIIGAGPIGLEAALYARFLGYDVEIFERGRVGENLLRAPEMRLAGPFGQHCSTLGLAALSAQDSAWKSPAVEAVLSCAEWVERYFAPMAASDMLFDGVRELTEIVGLERSASDDVSGEDADEVTSPPFLLTLRDATGAESIAQADAVIDCSGLAEEVSSLDSSQADWLRELRIEFCPATGAPRGMAEWLRGGGPADGTPPWQPLITSEPDFYILGAKSYGRAAPFTFALGLSQIRSLFTLIYDRPDLDIYQRMAGGFV